MTTDEFDADRQATGSPRAKHPKTGGSTPRWSTSRCWSCWPICGPTASRPSSSPAAASSSCARGPRRSMAFRRSRSSAAAARRSSKCATASPVLMRLPEVNFIDDRSRQAGRHPAASSAVGPIAAFGNSDGDLQMLQWTMLRRRPALLSLSCITPMPSANGPMIDSRISAASTRRLDAAAAKRLDGRRHEERLEAGLRIREVNV